MYVYFKTFLNVLRNLLVEDPVTRSVSFLKFDTLEIRFLGCRIVNV